MRKITFGGANSLDNSIARKDGAADWLMWSDEAGAMSKFFESIDTLLIRRKSNEVAVASSKGQDNPITT